MTSGDMRPSDISQTQKDRCCVRPLIAGPKLHKIHRDRKSEVVPGAAGEEWTVRDSWGGDRVLETGGSDRHTSLQICSNLRDKLHRAGGPASCPARLPVPVRGPGRGVCGNETPALQKSPAPSPSNQTWAENPGTGERKTANTQAPAAVLGAAGSWGSTDTHTASGKSA